MRSVENEECGESGVWRMRKMRSVKSDDESLIRNTALNCTLVNFTS